MAISSAGAEARSWFLPKRLVADLAFTLGRLAIVGLIAIGVSGGIAGAMGSLFGERFVSGDLPDITYTRARCTDFFEYSPGARSCEEAATHHHYGEVTTYRAGAGFLGLLALGVYLLIRRRFRTTPSTLPDGFEATVGTTLFGGAAAALLFSSLPFVVLGQAAGSGQYLSAGIVALALAALYGASLYRTLLRRAA